MADYYTIEDMASYRREQARRRTEKIFDASVRIALVRAGEDDDVDALVVESVSLARRLYLETERQEGLT